MNFEAPLTTLVWLTSLLSIGLTYVLSSQMIPDLGGDTSLWWKLSTVISCGTLAGALIPEFVKIFTSTNSRHVREIVTSSREGGASLNILSGLVAGNFSAYWLGFAVLLLMSVAYVVSRFGLAALMVAPAVFAFGLVAFGFLGMGPVTIAVDSYGPVTDNAQSIYELSMIEELPNIKADIKKNFGFTPQFDRAKDNLEENDGAGNTFKATSKPVLIGTAVVGATTMIFATIVMLTNGLTTNIEKLSMLHPPFLLGLITGGAVIYWFTGASIQAVSTGAYRAVEFIKRTIKLDTTAKASVSDSKKVVAICTQYAQKGMLNIFLVVFFSALAFAFVEPFYFIGYLISIALFGLFQAFFMANAGGAWDNAKKVVETELRAKGTELHAAMRDRRHRGRPLQGHQFGGSEPDHQVHDAVRVAGGGTGGFRHDQAQGAGVQPRAGRDLPGDFDGVRLPQLLRHADRSREVVACYRGRLRRRLTAPQPLALPTIIPASATLPNAHGSGPCVIAHHVRQARFPSRKVQRSTSGAPRRRRETRG